MHAMNLWTKQENHQLLSIDYKINLFHFGCSFFYSHAGFVCSINLKLKSNQTNEHRMNVEQAAALSKSFIRLNGLSVTLNPRMFCLSGCNVCKYRPLTILTTFFILLSNACFTLFFKKKRQQLGYNSDEYYDAENILLWTLDLWN